MGLCLDRKAINRIKDYYHNKLSINSKIDIEFVDGKISGADANTTGINGSSSKI